MDIQNQVQDLKKEFLCPISKKKMQDPVFLTDGYLYQRREIQKWLNVSDKSPVTGQKVERNICFSNKTLRNLQLKVEALVKSTLRKIDHLNYQNQFIKNQIKGLYGDLESQTQTKKLLFKMIKYKFQNQEKLQQNLVFYKKQVQKIRESNKKGFEKNYQLKINILNLQKQHNDYKKNKTEEWRLRLQYQSKKFQQQFQKNSHQFSKIVLILLRGMQEGLQTRNLSKLNQMSNIGQNNEQIYGNQTSIQLQMYKFLVSNLKQRIDINENSLNLYPRIHIQSQERFSQIYNVIHIKLLLQLEQNLQKQINNKQLYDNFIKQIQGIDFCGFQISNQQWKSTLKKAQNYTNIKSILIDQINISKIKKQDLLKFSKLKFLKIKAQSLDPQTINQIQQFRQQNPHVIFANERSLDYQLY